MAFKLSADDEAAEGLHEINVTPFIDVMLVLLIVFMVAAPLATVSVPLELPVSSAVAKEEPREPVVVSLDTELRLFIGDDEVARNSLAARLDSALGGDREARIFLRADKTVAYGELMAVMEELRTAGYLKVALVTLDGADG